MASVNCLRHYSGPSNNGLLLRPVPDGRACGADMGDDGCNMVVIDVGPPIPRTSYGAALTSDDRRGRVLTHGASKDSHGIVGGRCGRGAMIRHVRSSMKLSIVGSRVRLLFETRPPCWALCDHRGIRKMTHVPQRLPLREGGEGVVNRLPERGNPVMSP
ncbi:hypothetical protein LX36DRAFT_466312 [Colletotrichum falcatum]|nr:hypothetical protein LX36DRAFT_466312 [Colletotrichum falcatum]